MRKLWLKIKQFLVQFGYLSLELVQVIKLLSIFIYFTVFRLSYWLLISNPVHNASGQYLFNLAKTLSLVPHKKKCQVKKPKYKKVGGQAAEDQKQIRTSSWWINHPGSVLTKFYSCHWLIVFYLLVKNKKRGGEVEWGLKERGTYC